MRLIDLDDLLRQDPELDRLDLELEPPDSMRVESSSSVSICVIRWALWRICKAIALSEGASA